MILIIIEFFELILQLNPQLPANFSLKGPPESESLSLGADWARFHHVINLNKLNFTDNLLLLVFMLYLSNMVFDLNKIILKKWRKNHECWENYKKRNFLFDLTFPATKDFSNQVQVLAWGNIKVFLIYEQLILAIHYKIYDFLKHGILNSVESNENVFLPTFGKRSCHFCHPLFTLPRWEVLILILASQIAKMNMFHFLIRNLNFKNVNNITWSLEFILNNKPNSLEKCNTIQPSAIIN